MKKLITPLAIVIISFLFCFAQCKKTRVDNNGLPPASQEGKNTLGFLLNGQPWTPQGFNGTANLSIDYDPNFNNGVLGIVAYRTLSATDKTQFILGMIDSLNFLTAPFSLEVNRKSIGALSYSTKAYFDLNHYDTSIYQKGKISIIKFDKINRIIAGAFSGVLYKQLCGDSIKITDGRFDMKF